MKNYMLTLIICLNFGLVAKGSAIECTKEHRSENGDSIVSTYSFSLSNLTDKAWVLTQKTEIVQEERKHIISQSKDHVFFRNDNQPELVSILNSTSSFSSPLKFSIIKYMYPHYGVRLERGSEVYEAKCPGLKGKGLDDFITRLEASTN